MAEAFNDKDGSKTLNLLESRFNTPNRHLSQAASTFGQQIQAISLFPQLFDDHPYPVIINAAVLKLADWFKSPKTNNLIKFYIYKVFRRASEQHLSKVINVDEALRRIIHVINSVDPVARSLTLRVLGCMSVIIANRPEVHHRIIQSLENATEQFELESAIWAADCICARSEKFPARVCGKLAPKIEDPTILQNVKIKLVRIFRHMYRDVGVAQKARFICLQLMNLPSTNEEFALVILRTLTALSEHALIDRAQQINLLFEYALNDPREPVQSGVLGDLMVLCRNELTFDESHVLKLLRLGIAASYPMVQSKALKCLKLLLNSRSQLLAQLLSKSPYSAEFSHELGECVQKLVIAENGMLVVRCAEIVGVVMKGSCRLIAGHEHNDPMELDDGGETTGRKFDFLAHHCVPRLLSLIGIWSETLQTNNTTGMSSLRHELKEAIKCLTTFALLDETLAQHICDGLCEHLSSMNVQNTSLLAMSLAIITKRYSDREMLSPELLRQLLEHEVSAGEHLDAVIQIFKLWFNLPSASHARDESTPIIISLLHTFGNYNGRVVLRNSWGIYLISREAGLQGWYRVQVEAIKNLIALAESEATSYWLKALFSIGQAECLVADAVAGADLQSADVRSLMALNKARQLHIVAITQLKALETMDSSRTFQRWFLQLRCDFLGVVRQILAVINMWSRAGKEGLNSRDQGVMQFCAQQLNFLARKYYFVGHSFFDIDDASAQALQRLETLCLELAYAVSSIVQPGDDLVYTNPQFIPLLEHIPPPDLVPTRNATPAPRLDLPKLESATLLQQVEQYLIHTLKYPMSLPRYFFARKHGPDIQLTVEPTLSETDAHVVKHGEKMVVKVEGIVSHVGMSGFHRQVQEIEIVCFVSRGKVTDSAEELDSRMKASDPIGDTAAADIKEPGLIVTRPSVRRAVVQASYFTTTFLVGFPLQPPLPPTQQQQPQLQQQQSPNQPKLKQSGQGADQQEGWVNLFVRAVDNKGDVWNVGPSVCGLVKW